MRKMKKDTLYLIKWKDHFSTQGWFSKDVDLSKKNLICRTVGYLVSEDKEHVHLAQTDNEWLYGDIMSIMKSGIVKVKKLQ